jgi:Vitamin K-dependent gamma-carboxylase
LRVPVLLQLRDRAAGGFAGVGALWWLDDPIDDGLFTALIVVAIVAGVGFTVGAWFRFAGPAFALATLVLTTYRSSWGQLLHFENLMVLHLLIVGFAASADAWSIDARRADRSTDHHDYSSPLRLACIVVVVAYVIAGVAKLRYGGIEWIAGDTLRNHIAYSAARLDLLGGTPSPLARPVVDQAWVLPPMAAASVAIELAAPIALLGGWWRNAWVIAAWVMHVGIAALMLVAFPYPLFLVAFLPFFELERVVPALARTRLVG